MDKTEATKPKTRIEVGGRLKRLVMFLLCAIGKHEREYWTDEQCENANVFTGVFRPWKCRHCSSKGQSFPIPEMPPMPACKPVVDLQAMINASLVESAENKERFKHNSKTSNPEYLQPYQNEALLNLVIGIEARLET